MSSKKTIQNILIGLLVAVALLVGYSLINEEAGEDVSAGQLLSIFEETGSVDDGEIQLANQEILRILSNIQNIELKEDIFKNPVFRDLRDTRFTIPRPTIIGRPNPFLPIGFDDVSIQEVQDIEPVVEEIIVEDPIVEEFFEAGLEV